jgi:hypothetical protein
MATTKKRLIERAEALGCEVSDNSGRGELILSFYTPEGVIWKASDCHTIGVAYYSEPAVGVADLAADMDKGTRPCDITDCDVCNGY